MLLQTLSRAQSPLVFLSLKVSRSCATDLEVNADSDIKVRIDSEEKRTQSSITQSVCSESSLLVPKLKRRPMMMK